ncbi:MAG: CoA-binding protein [Chloroflexota bacterium]
MDQEQTVETILRESKTIAVVGLSDNPARPSHGVAEYLKSQGYRIIPVNPTVGEVFGEKSYPDLAAVPEAVDVVEVFRRSEHVPPIAEAAVKKGARALWLQDGVSNPEAEEMARQAGLLVVSDDCMAREHQRLRRQGRL